MNSLLALFLTLPFSMQTASASTDNSPSQELLSEMSAHRDCIASKIHSLLKAEVQSGRIDLDTDSIADQSTASCGVSRNAVINQLQKDLKTKHPRLSKAGLKDAMTDALPLLDEISAEFSRNFAREISLDALNLSKEEVNAQN